MHWVAIILALALAASSCSRGDAPSPDRVVRSPYQHILVLDGDTIVFEAQLVRIAGIDAPELAPNAHCWAEAALATQARVVAESGLHAPRATWRLTNVRGHGADGRVMASLTRDDGEDLAGILVVRGVAAATAGHWDWCGSTSHFTTEYGPSVREYGPTIWRTPERLSDTRAND